MTEPSTDTDSVPFGPLAALRASVGGALMGLANLVPGVSGGTMLLAAGVYPAFIDAVAEVTTLKFRRRSLLVLGVIGLTAAAAILLLAGPTKDAVVHRRWIMYSLFVGLTLGGVPLVWRLAGPRTPALFLGAAAAFAAMVAMAFSSPPGASGGGPDLVLLFLSGLAGASAMILPGISGGYLLLLLGQYVPILAAVDDLKTGLQLRDTGLLVEALGVAVPVGLGVMAGVVGVSNLLRWLLGRYRSATLGALLGLLLGAVVGLWPFQHSVEPEPGEVIKGTVVTEANRTAFEVDDWRLERFSPTGGQAAGAVALVAAGFLLTVAIDRMGGRRTTRL